MKITVNGGHTPKAPGARGYIDELREDRKLKDALIAELRARGHEVVDTTSPDWMTQEQDLTQQCEACNQSGAELNLSVHFNSAGGKGPEVWYWQGNEEGAEYAARISKAIAEAIGRPNRGAKTGIGYWFLKHTNRTSLIIETCFVDTPEDASAYLAAGPEKVARAIADAIGGEVKQPHPEKREPLEVDGIKGVKTVSRLQEILGVTVDGIEGPETIRALQKALNELEV